MTTPNIPNNNNPPNRPQDKEDNWNWEIIPGMVFLLAVALFGLWLLLGAFGVWN